MEINLTPEEKKRVARETRALNSPLWKIWYLAFGGGMLLLAAHLAYTYPSVFAFCAGFFVCGLMAQTKNNYLQKIGTAGVYLYMLFFAYAVGTAAISALSESAVIEAFDVNWLAIPDYWLREACAQVNWCEIKDSE